MPLLRVPRRFVLNPGGGVRRGEIPVTELTDTRHFIHPPAPMDVYAARTPGMDWPVDIGTLEGDLLVFLWKPLGGLIGGVGMPTFPMALGSAYYYFAGVPGPWGWIALVGVPLTAWMLIWYPFFARYRRFVIFDRRRGLVHLPRWLSRRRPDAVRWEDFGVLVKDIPGGYMGMSPETVVYAVRPPYSLWRRQYPPWYARIPFLRSGAETHESEQSWRRIASYMTEPLEDQPWVAERKCLRESATRVAFNGDWVAYRRKDESHCWPLYGSELLTAPNWVYDEAGRWQRLPEGPRERLVPSDGPEEKRMPVDPNEPWWRRIRRRLVGEQSA